MERESPAERESVSRRALPMPNISRGQADLAERDQEATRRKKRQSRARGADENGRGDRNSRRTKKHRGGTRHVCGTAAEMPWLVTHRTSRAMVPCRRRGAFSLPAIGDALAVSFLSFSCLENVSIFTYVIEIGMIGGQRFYYLSVRIFFSSRSFSQPLFVVPLPCQIEI